MRRRRKMESHKSFGNATTAFNSATHGTARRIVDETGKVTYVADGRIAQAVMKRQRLKAREAVIANTKKLLSIQL